MFRKTVLFTALTASFISLAACNTVKGFGEDVQSVGRAGEEAIN
ncbi:entericidin A/B family lipoprotein [Croceicoccus mobilis]|uniref:Entericidin n=1 Tax=Croceicoccus mobilis TaxID=1703339 RepID=A0A917DP08_9SPHN|nr:entericidin A/B family lipoprotein [Croceicoccus mobilis]GGD57234.1 hypothetical protein GCM10010990_03060 [Croceicoccus mobilis]